MSLSMSARRADVDLLRRDAERFHQRVRVLERVLAGREAGHRVGEDVVARQAEPVHCAHGDERACVESSPPDTPITTASIPVAAAACSRPSTWML